MTPAAYLEAWVWRACPLAVTFGGVGPDGDLGWRVAVWRAIAAEAQARAEEEAGTRPLGQR